MAIRRLESFHRMDSIMDLVEDWFFTDETLAAKVDRFFLDHAMAFIGDAEHGLEKNEKGEVGNYVFSPDDDDELQENQRRRGHRRKEVHNAFTELFEISLEDFIRSKRVAFDQFQQVFQISQEEEIRDGEKFYRWIDAAEYAVFIKVIQQTFLGLKNGDGEVSPAKLLRDQICKRMEEARLALRRRKCIRPLLDKWDLYDFNQLVKVLQDPNCPKPTLQTGQEERKFLARWRIKLTQQQRENRDQKTDRETMTEYVGRFAEDYTDRDFEALMGFLHDHVNKLPLNESAKKRRVVWEFFAAMDQKFTGSLLFDHTVKFLQRNLAERFHGKDFKKICSKWAAQIKRSNIDKLEINIEEFQGFMAEVLSGLSLEEFQKTVEDWTKLKIELDT